MHTRRILPLLGALLLAGSAAGAVTLKERFEKTVPLRAGSAIQLKNVNGSVTVEAWDRNEVRVEAEKQVKAGDRDQARKVMDQIHIDVTPGASGVRIETRMPKRENGFFEGLMGHNVNASVSYRVQVPRQVALDILNSNGGIRAVGTRGQAHLETSNGALTTEDVRGDMRLETSNGAITVARSQGAVTASTTNGAITAELTDLPDGRDLRFETSNGGVSLRLPRDARLSVDASTSNGGVSSDFAVEGGQTGRQSLKGDINGGGAKLFIRTSNGRVALDEI
ncbi:MAG: DUF4097 family beta strand repeat-containing protein [Thermoanaerobaculia bacterium]